MRKDFFKDKTT